MVDTLYHYTDLNGIAGIISSKTLWATRINYLNDYKEFMHAVGIAKGVINSRKSLPSTEPLSEFYTFLESRINSVSTRNIVVTSLSEEGDLLSQWRGYCANGPGYSIGFNKKALAKRAGGQLFKFGQCIYDPAVQLNHIQQLVVQAEISVQRIGADKVNEYEKSAGPFISSFLRLAPFIKHEAFQEEREWRLVNDNFQTTEFLARKGRGIMIPYLEFKLTVQDGDIPIDAIILGPGHDFERAAHSLSNWLSQNNVKNPNGMTPSRIPYRTT